MASAWPTVKLGDLFQIKHGFAFKGEHFADKGEFVLLTPGNFKEEGGIKLKGEKEKFYSGKFPEEYLLHKGDIVVAMTDLIQNAPILGSSAIIPRSGAYLHNQRLGKITALKTQRALPEFVYYLFNMPLVRGQIKGSATGATVKHTAPSRIYDVSTLLPPLPVQQRITDILRAYDELIENSQRRIKILESMARTLYREWFVHFRFPGYENYPRVASPLGEIPQGWEVKPFTEIADVLSGGTPKTDVSEYWNGEIPFFTPRDAPDCFYVQETDKHVTELGLSKCASALYPPDTVFITARGTVGKVAVPSVPMAMNQSCYALRGKVCISQRYLFLLTLQQVDYLKTNTGGATFDTIVVDTFRRMKIVKPPDEVIAHFSGQVDTLFEQVKVLQRQVRNLRRTRDLLLPRLLSGQIEVKTLPEGIAA